MELQAWRRLAVQTVLLFLVVMVSGICFSARLQKKLESEVQAKSSQNRIGTAEEPEEKEPVKMPTVATKSLVEKRSDSYIQIPKKSVFDTPDVYIQNRIMDFQIVMTLEGIPAGSVKEEEIFRIQNSAVVSGGITESDKLIKKMEIRDRKKADTQNNEIQICFTMKKAYEPVLFEAEDAYYISLLEARKAYEKIVVIDAGHGGIDEGTSSVDQKHHEKDYAIYVQQKLAKLLENEEVKVYYTRTADREVSKKDRIRLVNALKADLLVSIHCNASSPGDTASGGVETLYSKRKVQYGKLSNKKLAQVMLEEVIQSTGRRKRGTIVRDGLYLLHHSRVPATIVEIAYMTNKDDMKFLKKEIGQQKIAEGIYQGIMTALQ